MATVVLATSDVQSR